jgi:serine O-acetyltransferase
MLSSLTRPRRDSRRPAKRPEAAGQTVAGPGPIGRVVTHVREDLDAGIARDPAIDSRLEMFIASPGLHAIWAYRVAHRLWGRPRAWLAGRVLSQLARATTGVEIHPGARIGRRFFIDHGMGVVIGETAEVGDDVMMYHGATLGGRSTQRVKRHPTVGNRATIGTGARILGPVTLGDDVQVGANSVVVKDVPTGAVATGIPARVRQPAAGQDPEELLFRDPAIWI